MAQLDSSCKMYITMDGEVHTHEFIENKSQVQLKSTGIFECNELCEITFTEDTEDKFFISKNGAFSAKEFIEE